MRIFKRITTQEEKPPERMKIREITQNMDTLQKLANQLKSVGDDLSNYSAKVLKDLNDLERGEYGKKTRE